MTGPMVQPPNISQGPVIQDPGMGGAIAGALGKVLAALQQKREEEYRAQVLAQKTAEAQQQMQYQQGMLAVQQQQEARAAAEAARQRTAAGQVGGVQRRAMGGAPQQSMQAPAPPPQQGNFTQAQQAMPGQAPAQRGNFTQGQTGLFHDVLAGGSATLVPAQGNADIFGGVADENIPAAVQGLQEVEALKPKPPEAPTSAKEFEYFTRLASHNPEAARLYKSLFLDPKPTTQITNIAGAGETEFSKKWAELQAGVLSEGRKSAEGAIGGFPMLNEAYTLADKALTGVGANAQLGVARVLSALGVKAGKDATENTQTLRKLTGESSLVYLRSRDLGSGTAVSDADRNFVLQLAGGDITLDRGSIKKILRINVGAGIMKTEDAIRDLRDQSIAYPQNASQLNAQAALLERRLAPVRKRYAEMIAAEGSEEAGLRERLRKVPGMQLK